MEERSWGAGAADGVEVDPPRRGGGSAAPVRDCGEANLPTCIDIDAERELWRRKCCGGEVLRGKRRPCQSRAQA